MNALGYVTSHTLPQGVVPQRVQNLLVREFAHRQGWEFSFSLVEYRMPGSQAALEKLLHHPSSNVGIFYSFDQLCWSSQVRELLETGLNNGKTWAFALENLILQASDDLDLLDAIGLGRSLSTRSEATLEEMRPWLT